jgi:hypothetical protein
MERRRTRRRRGGARADEIEAVAAAAGLPPVRPFAAAAAAAADFIARGGLRADAGDSQVAAEAWPALAAINRAGLLTFDSQGGADSAHERQRAYVDGFLPAARAQAFVDAVNQHSDKVALLLRPVGAEWRDSHVVVTVARDGRPQSFLPLYMDDGTYAMNRRTAGLAPDDPALLVAAFDPVWGRRAAGRGGLFKDVLAALRRVALTPARSRRTAAAAPASMPRSARPPRPSAARRCSRARDAEGRAPPVRR